MNRNRFGRPTPSMVVALTALVFAMSGAGYAATQLESGGPTAKASKKKGKSKRGPAGPQGPAGAAGAAGVPGATGAAGTARAYGRVNPSAGCSPSCAVFRSKGISTVTRSPTTTGLYCVRVPGVTALEVSAVVSVDFGLTANPAGNASALVDTGCAAPDESGFAVRTQRIPTAGGAAVPANDVAFTIVVP